MKPVPPPRPLRVSPSPKEVTCAHGTLEEIDDVTFCVLCGLETNHRPYKDHPRDKVPRGLTFRKHPLESKMGSVPPPRVEPPENVNIVWKYEKARVIGVRARQIANGAQPRCSVEGLTSSLDIATREYEQGLSVFKRRTVGAKEGIYFGKSVGGRSSGRGNKGRRA